MFLKQSIASIFLFFTSLIFISGSIGTLITTIYTCVLVPILLQKIWFNHYFQDKVNTQFYKNILFSSLFIITHFIIDTFILMINTIENTNHYIIPFSLNRIFFFITILFLWNHAFLKKQNIVFFRIFKLVQIIYIFFTIPIIIGLFIILIMIYNI